MKKLRTHNIKIDHDKFVTYLHKPTKDIVVVERKEMNRMDKLVTDNKGLENVPEGEMIEAVALQYDFNTDTFIYNDEAPTKKFKVNELEQTITRIR